MSSADSPRADDPQAVALVGRAVMLDSTAFTDFCNRYLDRVCRLVFYPTGHRTDAEDLTDQTFSEGVDGCRWVVASEARRQLDQALDWGRYAEVFACTTTPATSTWTRLMTRTAPTPQL